MVKLAAGFMKWVVMNFTTGDEKNSFEMALREGGRVG
jgi:hypothetical protein